MKLLGFNFLVFLIFAPLLAFAQVNVSGEVYDASNTKGLASVEIYNEFGAKLAVTNAEGAYTFTSLEAKLNLVFFKYGYTAVKSVVLLNGAKLATILLEPSAEQLSEVEIVAVKQKLFSIKRLKDVEGTAIYAGKKTEVILIDNLMANLASNNARQIYSQIVGLNIYQNDDAGL